MFVSHGRVNSGEDTPGDQGKIIESQITGIYKPVTDSHVPHHHIPDLYEGPLVLSKCWEVSFNEDIWSEPGVLHLQLNVLLTEPLVEAGYGGLAEQHVGEGVCVVGLVLGLQVGRHRVPHLVWPAGGLDGVEDEPQTRLRLPQDDLRQPGASLEMSERDSQAGS